MSVLDSRRYRRRSTASFTREEFEQIKNTPPADLTEIRAESARIMERMLKAQEQEIAQEQENASIPK